MEDINSRELPPMSPPAGAGGYGNYGLSPSNIDMYGSIINKITDPSDLLEFIEMNLKSLKETQDGSIVRIGRPRMSDQGVNEIMTYLKSVISQNSIFSNIEDRQELSQLIENIINTINLLLMTNSRSFGVEYCPQCHSYDIERRSNKYNCLVCKAKFNQPDRSVLTEVDKQMIMDMCLNPIYLCLKRPYKQGEKEFWSVNINENVQQGAGKSGGFFNKINPFK